MSNIPRGARPIPPVSGPAKYDYETDVLVLGGGGPGLMAAVAAREEGKAVLVLEKSNDLGGETKMGRCLPSCGGSKAWQEQTGRTWTQEDIEAAVKSHSDFCRNGNDVYITRKTVEVQGKVIDRMSEMGVKWVAVTHWLWPQASLHIPIGSDVADYELGYPWLFKLGTAIRTVERWCKKNGVEFLMETPATALIKSDGRIVGARATTKDGKTIHVKAARTIITTGNFGANRDMIEYYGSLGLHMGGFMGPNTNTGDGIRMGQGVGADVGDMASVDGTDGAVAYRKGNYFQNLYMAATQLARQPYLKIDKQCRRVFNEYGPAATKVMKAINAPGSVLYTIFDSNIDAAIAKFGAGFCERVVFNDLSVFYNDDQIVKISEHPLYHASRYSDDVPGAWTFMDWRDGLQKGIDEGIIKKADTLETLAKELSLPPQKFKKCVEEYNVYAREGRDPVFGNTLIVPVLAPPFYGIEWKFALASTCGGLRINEYGQVLDKDGRPIPDLYAGDCGTAGHRGNYNVDGGLFSNIGICLTWGYIAGKNAAREKPWF